MGSKGPPFSQQNVFPLLFFLLAISRSGISLAELLHLSRLLGSAAPFTGIEGMALGTNTHFDLRLSGAGLKGIAAGTFHGTRFIVRVNFIFHKEHLHRLSALYDKQG